MTIDRIKQGVINRIMRLINERRGWKTDRKIVVIESDDWGSIRMPNRGVYNKMLSLGYRVDQCNYCKFDTLASRYDFSHLFEVLSKHKDKNNNHPIITLNTIMANPDFEKIKDAKFDSYFYEPFTETLKRYPNHSFESWQEGIDSKLIHPQLHGREHLNISRWMKMLQSNSKELHLAFKYGFFGFTAKVSEESNIPIDVAFNRDEDGDTSDYSQIINEATIKFNRLFKYNSKSFIAPSYHWDDVVEHALNENGVKYIQGTNYQIHPYPNKKKIFHYIGEKHKTLDGVLYLSRNAHFEPSRLVYRDWVSSTMASIERAFKLDKPAIISSHRVNFIGGIFENNRVENLKLLDDLLYEITEKWPDVEFFTSDELGKIIDKSSTIN